jgi:hypothetical protein
MSDAVWNELKTQLAILAMDAQQIAYLWDEIRALKSEVQALKGERGPSAP